MQSYGPQVSALLFACKVNWEELARRVISDTKPQQLQSLYDHRDGSDSEEGLLSPLVAACRNQNVALVNLILKGWSRASAVRTSVSAARH